MGAAWLRKYYSKTVLVCKKNRPIEEMEAGTLNIYLGLYLISAKKKDGGEYEPTSLNSIFAAIKSYFDDKGYAENIVTSDLFKGARDALASKNKETQGHGDGKRSQQSK